MYKKLKKFTSADYKAVDLLQSGLDHLKATAVLMRQGPELLDSAGYLAHMGLELMLKAWLLHRNGEFEGTHSLPDLVAKLKGSGCEFNITERASLTLSYLSNFAELRYPSLKKPVEIGSEDLEQIIELANLILEQMPIDLRDEYEHIPIGRKGPRVIMRRPKDIPRNLAFETGITDEDSSFK